MPKQYFLAQLEDGTVDLFHDLVFPDRVNPGDEIYSDDESENRRGPWKVLKVFNLKEAAEIDDIRWTGWEKVKQAIISQYKQSAHTN